MSTTIRNFTITRTDGAIISGYMYPDSGNGYVTDTTIQGEYRYGSRNTLKAVCNMGQELSCCGLTMNNGDVVKLEDAVDRGSLFDRSN